MAIKRQPCRAALDQEELVQGPVAMGRDTPIQPGGAISDPFDMQNVRKAATFAVKHPDRDLGARHAMSAKCQRLRGLSILVRKIQL